MERSVLSMVNQGIVQRTIESLNYGGTLLFLVIEYRKRFLINLPIW